jgi:Na+/melibiose symporter-like transporter
VKRLSPGLKLAYSSGTITFACTDVVFISFILLFYRQVLGVSGTLTGAALLIALIVDAITDPLMGSFSDQFKSKWGRRHPFMMIGALPLGLAFVALLHPPSGLGEFQLFIWLTVCAIVLRTALTIFFIPYLALGAELSDDYHERSSVTTYRTTMGWVVALILYWGALLVVFAPGEDGSDGRLVSSNYLELGIWCLALILVFSFVSIFFTRSRIPHLPKAPEDGKRFTLSSTVRDIWDALQIPNFRVIFFVMLAAYMLLGVLPSVLMHLGVYFWEFSAKEMGNIGILMLLANLFVFAIMDPLGRRFEKHQLLQIAFAGYGFNLMWFIGLRLLGVLPENGHWSLLILFFFSSFFATCFMMLIHIVPPSILADIADEQELETGKRQEGVLFAAQGFSAKAFTGFGTFLGGWILDLVDMPEIVAPGGVVPEVLFKLGLISGPLLGCCFIIPVLITRRLKVSREKHAEVRQALERRREQQLDVEASET